MSSVAETLAQVRGLIERGIVEFVPGYEDTPEVRRPVRLTSEGHLVRVRSELKKGPQSVTQLFPSDALDLPKPSPEEWLRQMIADKRLSEYVHVYADLPLVVCEPGDDRTWWEPR